MKKWLTQPWIWILGVDLVYCFLLWPLQPKPGILYPFLSEAWYDCWEEFAVMRLTGTLTTGALLLIAAALGNCLLLLFSRHIHGRKKAGRLALGLLLLLFTVTCSLPLGQVREPAKRMSCVSNLKQIRVFLNLYAADFNGNYPPDLQTAIDTSYLLKETLRCPGRTRPNPNFSDYHYLGSGHRRDDPPFMLLADKDKNHLKNHKNAIAIDGTISQNEK